jgi:hypothetical protein
LDYGIGDTLVSVSLETYTPSRPAWLAPSTYRVWPVTVGASVRYMTAFVISLAERERKSLHARIEKLDLELSIVDGLRLSDQLIQP